MFVKVVKFTKTLQRLTNKIVDKILLNHNHF